MRILFIDTETGGLDPAKNALLQIGGVMVEGRPGLPTVSEYNSGLIRPSLGQAVEDGALKVNGFHRTDIYAARPLSDAVAEFLEWATIHSDGQQVIIGGHQTDFDLGYIKEAVRAAGMVHIWERLVFRRTVIDTKALAHLFLVVPGITASASLGVTAGYFAIDFGAHDALEDAKATAEVARRFMGRAVF